MVEARDITVRQVDADDTDVLNVIACFYRYKFLILFMAVIFAAVAIVSALIIEPRFRSEVTVAIVESQSNLGNTSSASGLGSLQRVAAAFGQGGSSSSTDRDIAIATLESVTNAADFIEEKGLLPKIFPSEWNAEHKTWKGQAPSKWDGARRWHNKLFSVKVDSATGLLSLDLSWPNAKEPTNILGDYIKYSDQKIREKVIKTGEENIVYLRKRLSDEAVADIRQMLSGLLTNQISGVMLANQSADFRYDIIDAPPAPMRPYFPRMTLWAVGAFLLGIVLGCLGALLLAYFGKNRSRLREAMGNV